MWTVPQPPTTHCRRMIGDGPTHDY